LSKQFDRRIQQLIEEEWLGLGDTSELEVNNPFDEKTKEDTELPHVHLLNLMRQPKNFAFTCKHVLNKQLLPFQLAILTELWTRPFPMLIGSRGMGKSFILAVYAMLRALLCPGSKIVIVGAAFRQAKVIFEYCEEIWRGAPILRDIVGNDHNNGPKHETDVYRLRMGESMIIALPLGDGTKIRGQRANIIIADEFASIPVDIFENVVAGFAAVNLSPAEKVKSAARRRAMRRLGLLKDDDGNVPSVPGMNSNQTILSGTAYYGFNHFADYWKRWKAIIESRGDQQRLEEIFHGEVPDKFNWRDYCVIRIPVKLLPEDFMDAKHVAKARATIHIGQYQMEYGACFALDSNGFFRRSLIESCVVGNPRHPIYMTSCGEVVFSAMMRGDPLMKYVMAVDPASEKDNFSICILELREDHRRIVHCWTTTRSRFKAKLAKGLVQEDDFYAYAARKIRDLHKLFPCERIAIDTQGGGVAVIEALGSAKHMNPGERAILPVVDRDNPKDTDNKPGEHIIELITFAKADWVAFANHGMRKDFEDKALLFPVMNPAELGLAHVEDRVTGRVKMTDDGDVDVYDTLEDCVWNIEELKDELATIVHSQTGTSMRDRWDTPETKLPGGKKGRLRKDRYSALLMANAVGRMMQMTPSGPRYSTMGGFAHEMTEQQTLSLIQEDHQNPDWYTKVALDPNYGTIVRRM